MDSLPAGKVGCDHLNFVEIPFASRLKGYEFADYHDRQSSP